MTEYERFVAEFEGIIRRAPMFSSIAWQAHCEILQADDLPELEAKLPLIDKNLEIFEDEREEYARLLDCKAVVKREIEYLIKKTADK